MFSTLKKEQSTLISQDSLDPYKAIRDWKRANNLYSYEGIYHKESKSSNNPITITTPAYKEINISVYVNVIGHVFETENKRYRITCQDTQPKRDILNTYQKDYVK
ncbi:MAG: hypothetical protein U9532_03475 ['Conium maculatum' witches'-broom phytoplasma]|nr:hypothetical protein ['Conium maculatum' witches'-broom phytoplasma]